LPATTEFFHKHKQSKGGLRSRCKECRKTEESKKVKAIRKKKWYEENKEYARIYRKKYYEEVYKEINNEKCRIYRQKNYDRVSAQERKYRLKHKEKIKQWSRDYYQLNADKKKTWQREWRRKNPEQSKAIDAKKHHKRKAIESNLDATFTNEQWENCKKEFENKCAYCGKEKDLARDHFIPVSSGGEYTLNNIVPACVNCNSSKNRRDFFEWYPSFRYYSKRRESKILNYLDYKNNHQQLSIL
jgi:5-methylcytosine-specific restriction endonuclease McrA